jgi:tyrosine-protein kinase Etk/Wzc
MITRYNSVKNTKTLTETETQSDGPETNPDEPQSAQDTAPSEDEVSLLDLAIVLVRHRRRILSVTVVTILAGLLLAFVLPVKYTATTSILPPQQTSSAGAALLAQLGGLGPLASAAGSLGLKNPNDLEVALLKSRTVEDAVATRFHLMQQYQFKRMSDARVKLEHMIEVESTTKDPLIRISATNRDPQQAADMANGYVEEFKKLSSTLAVTEAAQRRVFFEGELRQAKENLANAEEYLKETQQKTGLLQLDSQVRVAIESAASLRAQVVAKQVEISAMQSYAGAQNPQLYVAEEQLAALQAQLTKMGSVANGTAPVLTNGTMQQQSLDYLRRLRDVKYYETIFELLARQLEVAKVDEARQGAMVQVIDKAVMPDRHSSPKRTFIFLGSIALGFLIGVGWAFAKEAIRHVANNPDERTRLEILKSEFMSRRVRRTRSS